MNIKIFFMTFILFINLHNNAMELPRPDQITNVPVEQYVQAVCIHCLKESSASKKFNASSEEQLAALINFHRTLHHHILKSTYIPNKFLQLQTPEIAILPNPMIITHNNNANFVLPMQQLIAEQQAHNQALAQDTAPLMYLCIQCPTCHRDFYKRSPCKRYNKPHVCYSSQTRKNLSNTFDEHYRIAHLSSPPLIQIKTITLKCPKTLLNEFKFLRKTIPGTPAELQKAIKKFKL